MIRSGYEVVDVLKIYVVSLTSSTNICYENTTLRSKSEALVAAALAFSRSITP